jgi:flagellar protein FlgJ
MALTRTIHQPEFTASIFDFGGLNSLRRGVAEGANAPVADQKKVAHRFEALFIQQFLKQARQAVPSNGPFDSQQTRMARSLADQQMSMQLATPGLGLARALLAQIQAGRTSAGAQDADGAQRELTPSSRVPDMKSSIGPAPGELPSIASLLKLLNAHTLTGAVFNAVKEAPQHIRDFVAEMSGAANIASNESGVPAKLILSQAALESGWGRHEIRGTDGEASHNLFGIKATPGWKGKVVNVLTTEYVDGQAQKVVQPFRAYDSYADSFADYARLISQSPRYSGVMTAPTAEDAARQVQASGYATDPNYAQKLISIMGYFNTAGGAA